MDERRAPVQGEWNRERTIKKPYGTVAWSEHLLAWDVYAQHYGRNQSAERMAERAGFGYWEITELLGHEPKTWQPIS